MTVLEALDRASKMFPNAKVTGEQLDIYAEELADLPDHYVVQAILECARTQTFFPSLSEIRNRVTQIAGESVLVDAEAAWGEVLREIRRVGAEGKRTAWIDGKSVTIAERQFSSPMIERAVEAVGWKDICLTETDDLPTLRAQFRDALRAIQRREVDRIVSGRHAVTGPALDEGNGQRDGLMSIGDVVSLREPELN